MPIPVAGIERFEPLDWKRSIYNVAHFVERSCTAGRQDLDCYVSESCCFGWPGKYAPTSRICGHLIEQAIFRASPNHTDFIDSPSDQLFKIVDYEAVLESKTFESCTHIRPLSFRRGLMSFGTELIDRGGHVGGSQERRVVRIHKAAEGILAL